ncbi:MAG: ABC transporter [Dyadobacter sp. 50-39]|mgnify:CR=1 FL=1|uniref:DinB family protein n=1 Tax=Dyadobacter sp. 50-39 TaxID=1895756 RepID=UPI0009618E6D|nr:DinB family protein [Dyadobacter sp. 50-39]OJV12867.1 MAG: ABC transporter [Dyadobacter sp. 50-39]
MHADQRKKLINELTDLVKGGNAHVTLEEALSGIPADQRAVTPANLPYSIWQLVEHIRIAQKDIVDFSISKDYQTLIWPDEYWPQPTDQVSDAQWEESVKQINNDQQRFFNLLHDEQRDLFSPLPWGSGQNIVREAMLIADHNSYHTAEIIVARRLLGIWK